jgi:outer membrane translocation and assembly module TamA
MLPYSTSLNSDGRADIPFAERRMLGGSNTTRGWVRNHLGPYSCDAESYVGDLNLGDPAQALACAGLLGREQVTTAITPIGGTSYLSGTLELRKYFVSDVGIAVFNDWGMVWNTLADVEIWHLIPSVGAGLRYKSPIGAIRFDGAYRLDTEPMFALEPAFQAHFGLSEAF